MFPIVTPVMLNTPDMLQATSLSRLPWPDGSVVSARLTQSDTPGNALLLLGSYRLLAKVPPSTPMGDVWLMLINRQMPARFALLSDAQVLQMLSGMLEAEQGQPAKPGSAARQHAANGSGASLLTGDASEWPNLATPQRSDGRQTLPWTGEPAADGNTLLWYDRQDEQPRGMLHRQVGEQAFSLSGRVDLDRLGSISFSLSGSVAASGHATRTGHGPDDPSQAGHTDGWQLSLHAAGDTNLDTLRRELAVWIEEQGSAFPGINTEVSAGMPDTGPGGLTERTV